MILIDATPLQSEHRFRGVGAYVRQLVTHIEAAGDVQPRYLATWQDRRLIRDVLPAARTLTAPAAPQARPGLLAVQRGVPARRAPPGPASRLPRAGLQRARSQPLRQDGGRSL